MFWYNCYIVLDFLARIKHCTNIKLFYSVPFLMRVDINQLEFDYLLINVLFTQQTLVQIYSLFWKTTQNPLKGVWFCDDLWYM